jgi:hypothetical protein
VSAEPVLRGAFAAKLPHSTVVRAWRVAEGEGTPAIELDVAGALTFVDAINAAFAGQIVLLPKETVLVHRFDEGRRKGELRAYRVRQESKPSYRRDPVTGATTCERRLYPELQFSLPVDAFEPTRGFDALRDCPVGADLHLVTQ